MPDEAVPCPRCHGKGRVKCDECGGRGYITCPTCGGSKTIGRPSPFSSIPTNIPSLRKVQPLKVDLRDTGLKPPPSSPSKSLIGELGRWLVLIAIAMVSFLLINAVLRLIP